MRSIFQAKQSDVGQYWVSNARADDLREIIARPKRADDNPGTDDFERSFSSLAHQYIKSRAPQLIDYAIGFQTIKRVDDPARSKAVGVFGFKVDDLWLFVPVFFLQGDLKGHELLWVKNRDNFLPCKENWVTFLINRQPTEIGEPSQGSYQDLGGRKPSFRRLFTPQFFGHKFAAWTEPILPLFAAAELAPERSHRKTADWSGPFDLRKEAAADPTFLIKLNHLANTYPLIKRGLDTWYGPDMITELAVAHKKTAGDILSDNLKPSLFPQLNPYAAILQWPARFKFNKKSAGLGSLFSDETPAHPSAKVNVLRTMESVYDMDESSKRKFARDGFVAIDNRVDAEVNKVAEDINNEVLSPNSAGVYETAMRDGEFQDMVILTSVKASPGRNTSGTLVINPKEKEQYGRFPTNEVLARPDSHIDTILEDDISARAGLRKWLKSNGTTDVSINGIYIAVDDNLNSTLPFIVTAKTNDKRFTADWREYQTARLGVDDTKTFSPQPIMMSDCNIDFSLGQPGRKIMSGRGWVSIPESATLVKLEQRSEDDRWKDGKVPDIGNIEHVLSSIQKKYAKCSLFHDGEKFEVKLNSKSASFVRDREVVIDLMLRGGLREKEARDLTAKARETQNVNCLIKQADGANSNYSPQIPDPWTGTEQVGPRTIDATYRQREAVPVQDMVHPDPGQYYSEDQWFSPDSKMLNLAQQASASGQKDLFDIGVLVALANTTDTETMVDRFLGRYMSAIDGLGRTLFHIYNNYEALSERYGSSDMPQLEDGVRNTFTSLGDTTLYLKEKSVGGSNGFNLSAASSPELTESTSN